MPRQLQYKAAQGSGAVHDWVLLTGTMMTRAQTFYTHVGGEEVRIITAYSISSHKIHFCGLEKHYRYQTMWIF